MNETTGAAALQIALLTMKERRQALENRVEYLEAENLMLMQKCSQVDPDKSLNEVETLVEQVAKLTEEKSQLHNKIQMVTSENKQLWSRLSKLTEDNRELDTKLTKISDKINQHSPLIRSKTFTQEKPHTKYLPNAIVDNDMIIMEFEDISLKILNSMSKEKSELELQCSQMSELQNEALTSFGFNLDDDENSMVEDIEQHVSALKQLKNNVLMQGEQLERFLKDYEADLSKAREDESELDHLADWGSSAVLEKDRVCPMCRIVFSASDDFTEFQMHVQHHFMIDS